MTFKKFFIVSVAVHLLVLIAVYFIPAPQAKKTREFFTQLISPEQEKGVELPLPPAMRPVPPEVLKRVKPHTPRAAVRPPLVQVPGRAVPTPDKPVVPGEGKEDGRPLPEGVAPSPGRGEPKGEGGDTAISSKPGLEPGRSAGRPEASGRERLFDPAIIRDAAKKGAGAGKKNDTITFDTQEYRYAGYNRKLKEKIESIWQYPAEAWQRKLYGDLKIRFTIKKDGRLGAVELLRTSGYKALDDAAMKALKDGEPYWPIPDEWGMDSYTIQGHFVYTMYGYGIR